jgi:Fur family zinc uptake transcriptional regulator
MGKGQAPSAAHSHHHHHPAPTDAAALIAHAERVCAEKSLQFTPLRRRVFEALAQGGGPLGAYDLVERLGQERRISPISVYRALEFLMEAGLIHRIAVRNTYLPCAHEHGAGETTVFLVCTVCGNVDELASSEIARDLAGTAAQVGFRPASRAVELEGECQSCRETP